MPRARTPLLAAPVGCQGFVLRRGGAIAVCGQIVVEGELVGLYDVFTAPPARGQGLASRLCEWLLTRAAEQGARQAYLQVGADNGAARAVYRKLGFVDGYRYHHRTPVDHVEVSAHTSALTDQAARDTARRRLPSNGDPEWRRRAPPPGAGP